MRTLYYSDPPNDIERLKSAEPGKVLINGARIYHSEFFRGLLRYSSFDRIFVPARSARAPDIGAGKRLETVSESEVPALTSAENLTFVTPGIALFDLFRIRRLVRRPRTPCTGIIHSLDGPNHPLLLLGTMLSGPQSWDALVCSSNAGLIAMQNGMRLLSATFGDPARKSLPAIRMPVIPLGIDAEQFRSAPQDIEDKRFGLGSGPIILFLGRLSPLSKADLTPLIIAFAEVSSRHPSAQLVIAGDDTQHSASGELLRLAGALACRNVRVITDLSTDEKLALYRRASVFVALSDNLQETFGITVLEAMAAGLPVIAADWSGYKELVLDGLTGFLIPSLLPEYPPYFEELRTYAGPSVNQVLALTTVVDPEALVHAMDCLLSNAGRAREFGELGAQRARQFFDWSVVIKKYEELWTELGAIAISSPGQPEREISHFPYLEIFAHFPTKTVSSQMAVSLTKRGTDWKQNRRELLSLLCFPSPYFSAEVFQQVLDAVSENPGRTLTEITDPLADGMANRLRCLAHAWRLWKLGLIQPVSP